MYGHLSIQWSYEDVDTTVEVAAETEELGFKILFVVEEAVVVAAGLLKLNETLFVVFVPDRVVVAVPKVIPVVVVVASEAVGTAPTVVCGAVVDKNENPDVAEVVGAMVDTPATRAPNIVGA